MIDAWSQVPSETADERSQAGFLTSANRHFRAVSGRVDLLLTGVSPEVLDSIRSISNLIGELRTEITAGRLGFAVVG